MELKCKKCGSSISKEQSFCPNCGKKISLFQRLDRIEICGVNLTNKRKIALLASLILIYCLCLFYNYARTLYFEHKMSEEYVVETVKGWLEEIQEERGDGGNFNLITDFDRKHLTKSYLALLDSVQNNEPSMIPELVKFERWTTISSQGLPTNKGKMVKVFDIFAWFKEWDDERRKIELKRRVEHALKGWKASIWIHYTVRTEYSNSNGFSFDRNVGMLLKYEDGEWKAADILLYFPEHDHWFDEDFRIKLLTLKRNENR